MSDASDPDPSPGPSEPGQISWDNPSAEELTELLQSVRRIAVVGLSADPARPSNGVAAYLIEQGYDVVPVNPNVREVFGLTSYGSLKEAPGSFDLVDVFRRPEYAPEIARQAVEIGARILWMQESIVSLEAYQIAREGGLIVVMDRCILKEHSRLF